MKNNESTLTHSQSKAVIKLKEKISGNFLRKSFILTGNSGHGKTTVAKEMQKNGWFYFDISTNIEMILDTKPYTTPTLFLEFIRKLNKEHDRPLIIDNCDLIISHFYKNENEFKIFLRSLSREIYDNPLIVIFSTSDQQTNSIPSFDEIVDLWDKNKIIQVDFNYEDKVQISRNYGKTPPDENEIIKNAYDIKEKLLKISFKDGDEKWKI